MTKQLIAGAVLLVLVIGVVVAVGLTLGGSGSSPASGTTRAEATPEAQVLAFIREDEAWEKCDLPPGQSLEQAVATAQSDISDPNSPANRLMAVVQRRFEVAPDRSFFIAGSPPHHQAGAEAITGTSVNGDEAVITTHLDTKLEGGIDYRYTLHRQAGGWLIARIEKSITKDAGQPVTTGT